MKLTPVNSNQALTLALSLIVFLISFSALAMNEGDDLGNLPHGAIGSGLDLTDEGDDGGEELRLLLRNASLYYKSCDQADQSDEDSEGESGDEFANEEDEGVDAENLKELEKMRGSTSVPFAVVAEQPLQFEMDTADEAVLPPARVAKKLTQYELRRVKEPWLPRQQTFFGREADQNRELGSKLQLEARAAGRKRTPSPPLAEEVLVMRVRSAERCLIDKLKIWFIKKEPSKQVVFERMEAETDGFAMKTAVFELAVHMNKNGTRNLTAGTYVGELLLHMDPTIVKLFDEFEAKVRLKSGEPQ